MKGFLSSHELESVIHAFIISVWSFFNAVYVEIRQASLVQNTAAQLLSGAKKRNHMNLVLASLRWLSFDLRIQCKVFIA